MQKKGFIVFVVVCWILNFSKGNPWAMPVWQKINQGILESDIHAGYIKDNWLFVCSNRTIYFFQTDNKQVEILAQLPINITRVNALYLSQTDNNLLYILSNVGLFQLNLKTKFMEKVFESSDALTQDVQDLITFGEDQYLATLNGVYVNYKSTGWQKLAGFDQEAVYRFEVYKDFLWAATSKDLWRMDLNSKRWKKIYSYQDQLSKEIKVENIKQEIDEVNFLQRPVLFKHFSDKLFLAVGDKLLVSSNEGKSFKSIFVRELLNSNINGVVDLNSSPKKIDQDLTSAVATNKGIFIKQKNHWENLYAGLESLDIRDVLLDKENTLWAITARGIFYLPLEQTLASGKSEAKAQKSEVNSEGVKKTVEDNPTIHQVQQWAIDYADVNPEKILDWRKQAARKAFLPDVAFGLNRDASEHFHWDTGANPDVLQKGRDLNDWDVSLSWKLGDLIWNSDQTSIDSRSKLMTELRQSILDQVTRLYFERRRLLIDNDDHDPDLDLRIQEITALIDGYTGGKLSAFNN